MIRELAGPHRFVHVGCVESLSYLEICGLYDSVSVPGGFYFDMEDWKF